MKSCIVGKFESFHRGHQKLIREAKKLADTVEILSIWPPPGNKNPLFTEREREYLARKFNVQLHNINFEKIKELSPEEFFIFLENCNCNLLVVGVDWKFGKNRSGDVKTAETLGKKYGIKVVSIPPVIENGKKISTSWIKELLENGQIKKANHLLGFNFFVIGISVKGQGIGKTLGFPTVNIEPEKILVIPFGVYEVNMKYDGKTFKGIANYGVRPTFKGVNPTLEVHIIGEDLEVKEKSTVKVDFIDFIREERKFKSVEELKKQIKLDVDRILNK
ncbi:MULTISPECIES: riboflavin biosynthesis protein RibF [unclassified Desulfurobacterium]|uniref:riboflavin biosynthesis protein RibF n=1 Tax=Desulfurobacterium sp. TC5-1 TaxID=1158318 RepID=UPI0003B778F4|nr:riboflavin biosynthesis protein RibF [Desulfurobacterium sp. TC5-1]